MKCGKIGRIVAAILLSVLLLTSCNTEVPELGTQTQGAEYPFTVNGVTIEKAVSRVAVFDDSLADVIMYLGSAYQLKLTARSSDCAHPDIQMLPTAGTANAPDVVKLEEQKVELVLTGTAFPEEIHTALTEKGIPVVVCEKATDRAGLIELYRKVASMLGGAVTGYELGEKRANSLLMAMDDIQRIVPESEVLPVIGYIYNAAGNFATDATFVGKLAEYAGAANVAADRNSLTAEELETANPTVLFCAAGLKEEIKLDERFVALTAVREDRLIELPAGMPEWQGKSLLDGLIRMVVALYPELESEGLLPEEPDEPEEGTTSSGTESPQRPVSVGPNSSYQDILTLQNRLIELGYMQPPGDGTYGYWTQACIKEFQRRAKLEQTGIADKVTMDALYSENAPKG